MSWAVYHEILEYLKVASACPVHPLSSLVNSLDQVKSSDNYSLMAEFVIQTELAALHHGIGEMARKDD